MKPSFALALVLPFLSTSNAQNWIVSPVAPGTGVFGIEYRDSPVETTLVCYGTGEEEWDDIYVAWCMDSSAQHIEHVCANPGGGAPSFDVSQGGELGVARYIYHGIYYLQRTTQGWVEEHLPSGGPYPCRPHLAFDLDGVPNVVYSVSQWIGAVRARRPDSTWVVDTAFTYAGGPVLSNQFWHLPPVFTSDNRPHLFFREEGCFGGPIYWDFLHHVTHDGDSWRVKRQFGGYDCGTDLYGFAADPDDSLHYLYNLEGIVYLDNETLPPYNYFSAALAYDSESQPHLCYNSSIYTYYSYRTPSGWHSYALPDQARTLAFALDRNNQPVVAFCARDTIWLARGVDIVGVENPPPTIAGEPVRQTICRATLSLAGKQNATLLDILGRSVMGLNQGENDIRHISPGVYFVRREKDNSAVKVVVQR